MLPRLGVLRVVLETADNFHDVLFGHQNFKQNSFVKHKSVLDAVEHPLQVLSVLEVFHLREEVEQLRNVVGFFNGFGQVLAAGRRPHGVGKRVVNFLHLSDFALGQVEGGGGGVVVVHGSLQVVVVLVFVPRHVLGDVDRRILSLDLFV